jgi:hypothetical protein
VHLFPNDDGPTNIPIRIEKEPKMATSKKTAKVAAKTPSKQAKKKTTNTRLDEVYCRILPETKPGRYVQLTVSDNG